jgi:disulfide bond formation protein DsbB
MASTPLDPVRILYFAITASLFSLAAAYTAQYGFGLQPCHLCLIQRIPFAVVTGLALIGMGKTPWRTKIIVLIALVFLINSGIAIYHAAVEKHVVSGPSDCTNGEAPENQSMDDFLKRIQSAPIAACDQPAWEYHGITMAGMNAMWCFMLFLTTMGALYKTRKPGGSNA